MAGTTHIFGRSTIFKSQASLGNHFTSVGANNVDTQHAVGLSIDDNLDETVGVVVGTCTRVGNERIAANLVLNTGFLQFLFVLANPGNFGVSVDDGGNSIIVDVTVTGSNHFRDGETFILGLVGQHGTESGITNAADVGDVGLELRVDNDAAAVVELDTNVLQAETLGVRATTNGDKDDIGFKLFTIKTEISVN